MTWEMLFKSFKSSMRILEVLEQSNITPEELYTALPSFIAVLAIGSRRDPVTFIDNLASAAKEIVTSYKRSIEEVSKSE